MPRYKLGVQLYYGEMKGQGLRVASKCLWDPSFDNWSSYTFCNETIHCTGIVFGTYTEWLCIIAHSLIYIDEKHNC